MILPLTRLLLTKPQQLDFKNEEEPQPQIPRPLLAMMSHNADPSSTENGNEQYCNENIYMIVCNITLRHRLIRFLI